MLSVVACHAGDLGLNPVRPENFFSKELLYVDGWGIAYCRTGCWETDKLSKMSYFALIAGSQ